MQSCIMHKKHDLVVKSRFFKNAFMLWIQNYLYSSCIIHSQVDVCCSGSMYIRERLII